MKSSSLRRSLAIVLPALAAAFVTGCFNSPDKSKLSCTTSAYCPHGEICVGTNGTVPGICGKPIDGGGVDSGNAGDRGGVDVSEPLDSTNLSAIDGSDARTSDAGGTGVDSGLDLPADPTAHPGLDGSADLGSLVEIDTAVDAPVRTDSVGSDLAAPDVPADLAAPDLAGPDVPADSIPDVATVPDLGPGCTIGGTFYGTGVANPGNACQTCQPSFSTTGWTVGANGSNCGSGQVCSGGICQSGCWIGGALVASGAANSSNACKICKPATSTTDWSNNPDGTTCNTNQVCGGGLCQSACYIGGAIFANGTTNSGNPCRACNPEISTAAWVQAGPGCAAITAGENFTCAVAGEAAKCWGRNAYGNLGNSSTTNSSVPVQVTGLAGGVQAVSASYRHVCALVVGGVQCWGWNSAGQLGDGSTTQSAYPVPVTGLSSGATRVAAGDAHSCALVNGSVECWGYNNDGQLGDGTKAARLAPVPAQGLAGLITGIASGTELTCALAGGAVLCWGMNSVGQLGNGSTTNSVSPVSADTASGVVDTLAAGGGGGLHTCASVDGTVQCWGSNSSGQLGNNSTTDSPTPVSVQGLPAGAQAVAAGVAHSCALVDGAVWCWGSNANGQLGNSTTTQTYLSAVAVPGLPGGVLAVVAGNAHTCALAPGGVWCWGSNGAGQLGNNSTTSSPTPVQVQGL